MKDATQLSQGLFIRVSPNNEHEGVGTNFQIINKDDEIFELDLEDINDIMGFMIKNAVDGLGDEIKKVNLKPE